MRTMMARRKLLIGFRRVPGRMTKKFFSKWVTSVLAQESV